MTGLLEQRPQPIVGLGHRRATGVLGRLGQQGLGHRRQCRGVGGERQAHPGRLVEGDHRVAGARQGRRDRVDVAPYPRQPGLLVAPVLGDDAARGVDDEVDVEVGRAGVDLVTGQARAQGRHTEQHDCRREAPVRRSRLPGHRSRRRVPPDSNETGEHERNEHRPGDDRNEGHDDHLRLAPMTPIRPSPANAIGVAGASV